LLQRHLVALGSRASTESQKPKWPPRGHPYDGRVRASVRRRRRRNDRRRLGFLFRGPRARRHRERETRQSYLDRSLHFRAVCRTIARAGGRVRVIRSDAAGKEPATIEPAAAAQGPGPSACASERARARHHTVTWLDDD
jgi:hypothetical protein